jgi:hypothetical protein
MSRMPIQHLSGLGKYISNYRSGESGCKRAVIAQNKFPRTPKSSGNVQGSCIHVLNPLPFLHMDYSDSTFEERSPGPMMNQGKAAQAEAGGKMTRSLTYKPILVCVSLVMALRLSDIKFCILSPFSQFFFCPLQNHGSSFKRGDPCQKI